MRSPFTRAAALAALALGAAPVLAAAQPLKGPAAEVKSGPELAVPAVPSFELAPSPPGVRSVRELRVRGQQDLGTEITVRGYVTWVYDCAKQIAKPGETPAQTQKRIDDDQTLCQRPKFYLGDTKDASPDRSIWVSEVPRPPTKMERQRLPKAELAKWPAVPKYALGDYVAVTGTWDLQSPRGDRSSDGLLVFKSLQAATPAPPATARPAAAAPRAQPAPPKVPPTPKPAPIEPEKQQKSIRQMNEGAKALGQAQWETATERYTAAVTTWPENHVAWYYLAYTYSRKLAWRDAVGAAANATRIAPDQAMYRLMHGLCLYEAAVQRAREAQAMKQGMKPEEVVPDLRGIAQDAALAQLELAIHLNDKLWRAHYYRGRILRDRGDDGPAAESFSRAVRSAPPQSGPYAALADLYRRWDHFDEAIEIARLGADNVVDPPEKADLYYRLGQAYEDKREDTLAVDAYTKALDMRRDLAPALFQRGQLYMRMKKPAAAKIDLEAFLASPGASAHPFARGTAARLLMEIAAKQP
jgi:tetratricopeptide (TPR) repeat protein